MMAAAHLTGSGALRLARVSLYVYADATRGRRRCYEVSNSSPSTGRWQLIHWEVPAEGEGWSPPEGLALQVWGASSALFWSR